MEALPEQFRLAVLLADVEGFSYKEIAEILDIPIGTVMSRLHRGRKALQKTLHDFGMQRGLVAPAAEILEKHRRTVQAGRSHMRRLTSGGECEEALRTLYHFLDGELTPDRRQAIQHHLDECSPCLEAFDFEAELKLAVARCCRDQVPERLRQRVAGSARPGIRTAAENRIGGSGIRRGRSSVR